MSARIPVLMCPPDYYDVEYVINPWMEGNIHRSSRERAMEQWRALADILKERADVQFAEPQPGLPDMVFTANAGVALGRDAVLSHFYFKERRGEQPHFHR